MKEHLPKWKFRVLLTHKNPTKLGSGKERSIDLDPDEEIPVYFPTSRGPSHLLQLNLNPTSTQHHDNKAGKLFSQNEI
jgi:hypothetical protein